MNLSNISISGKLLLVIAFLTSGCDEKQKAEGETERETQRNVRSHASGDPNHGPGPKKTRLPSSGSDFHKMLSDADDEDIVSVINGLVSSGNIKIESEDSTRVEDSLSELVRRRSSRVGDIIASLPPGRSSQSIVMQAFQRGNFKSIPEIFNSIQGFASPDLAPPAVRGAISQYLDAVKSGEASIGIPLQKLSEYRKQGIENEQFIDLLCTGLAKGEFSFKSAESYLNLHDQETVAKLSQSLPYEATGEILANALSNNGTIDTTGLEIYVRSYAAVEPQKSLAWAQTLPPAMSAVAVRSAFGSWVDSDPMSASKYVGSMAQGPARDEGAYVIARDCMKNESFGDARLWASEIRDEALRNRTLALIDKSTAK